MPPVKLIVAGAGSRGTGYVTYAERFPELARVVGVADPREFYRNRMAGTHSVVEANRFSDWRDMCRRPKFADAVIIATQDSMHAEPAVAFARKGYHILLEKPMAPNEKDCRRIVAAARKSRVIFAVCHVMRYTDYTRKVKEILDSGALGDVVSVQHLEPVGYWHQAHSFVRGNWGNEAASSPMLLAKSCHDIDWISYVMGGAKCEKIASFGTLHHFRREQKPAVAGAAVRCVDCTFEPSCPYSAKKLYLSRVRAGETGWPTDVITPEPTEESVMQALREGPYGRCVYECDNDVVDHQVVSLEFAGGRSATFTMTAFTPHGGRRTWIFGTRGALFGDGSLVEVHDFLTDQKQTINTKAADAGILGGHGGGDFELMKRFVEAVTFGDPSRVLSGPDTSLETHLMVFAAEKARRTGRVVNMK